MAKKISLREFQGHLADRLKDAAAGRATPALLGVQAGDGYWLLKLPDAGEIVPLPALTPVPLTRPWFAGIANVRGQLHAVADFSLFQGGEPTPRTAASRLLLVGARHGSNAALLVSRLLGLKNPENFSAAPADPGAAAWVAASRTDAEGRRWQQLDVCALLAAAAFMDIAA